MIDVLIGIAASGVVALLWIGLVLMRVARAVERLSEARP